MGALDYALAGAVKGGADTFLEISREERAEDREIKKETRVNDFQTIRDKRLAEINAEAAEKDRDFRSEESGKDREHRSTESAADRTSREGIAKNELDFEMTKPMTETTGRGAITKQYDPKTKTWQEVSDQPYDDGTLGGMDQAERSKFFAARSEKYFGNLDKSGAFVGFGSDRDAQLASSTASAADRMYAKYGGRVDPNTIFATVYKNVKSTNAATEADVAAIEEQLSEYDNEWWLTQEQDAEVMKLKKDLESVQSEGGAATMDVPDLGGKPSGGGMLDNATKDDDGAIPTITTKEQYDALESGAIYLRDGKRLRKK